MVARVSCQGKRKLAAAKKEQEKEEEKRDEIFED
jgi:hypothetical protein